MIPVAFLLIFNSLWFWQQYLIVRPVVNERAWQIGTKEMILTANNLAPNYSKVWISRSGWGWIHLVFHTRYDPIVLQNEIKASGRNEFGFWWVSDIGKYHLEWLPQKLGFTNKTLYIGTPVEFKEPVVPIYKIKDKSGKEIFWFIDETSIKTGVSSEEVYL